MKNPKNLKTLFAAFLLMVVCSLSAQTIITGAVTDSLNQPIPFANVYLEETTIGINADADGKYILKIPKTGHYQLFASCIGYQSKGMKIEAKGDKQTIDIQLSVNDFKLNEVTITASDKIKKRYYGQFFDEFIGKTANSRRCKILNPEDLHLYFEKDNRVLKGFSINPLKIENEALGYTIIYDLIDFSYNLNTRLFHYKGNYHFQFSEGSVKQKESWSNNRLRTFNCSRLQFVRALFSDSLKKENYKLYIPDPAGNYNPENDLKVKDIIIADNTISKKCYINKKILIVYTEPNSHYDYVTKELKKVEHKSLLSFLKPVNIYHNGMLEDGYDVIWDGVLGDQRMADMLPFDYEPDNQHKYETDPGAISFENNTRKDQVFVQTDRNLYSPGDTVYFQAYIRNALNGQIESGSASLFAFLFNEQKEIADSSRFKVFGSGSMGWLAIPKKAKLGKYRLVAYTAMMQNDNPEEAFNLDLKVDSKLVDPETATVTFNKEFYVPGDTIEATIKITTYKKHPIVNKKVIVSLKNENKLNEVDRSHTNDDGETIVRFVVPKSETNKYQLQVEMNKNTNKVYISKNFDIPFRAKYVDFKLLPEGGTLIANQEQRIGFNAVNASGESIPIVGLLKYENGAIEDTIKSGKYGPGLFVCEPENGMYVELINDNYEKKIWPLPAFDGTDVCLKVKPWDAGSILIVLQSNKYKGNEYSIAGFIGKKQYFLQNFKLDKRESFVINTTDIPTGALEVILLDNKMRPVAQRMVYVNADKRLKFNITSDTSAYSPGQETELTVSVTDSMGNPEEGIFSIAAVNYLTGINPETFAPNIDYSFNYCPYFKKNLPPKVLIDGLENLSNDERDLLLMVYGWSKILSNINPGDSIKRDLVNYDVINMKLLNTVKFRLNDRRIDLIALEGLNTKHLFTDTKGQVLFPLDSLDINTRTIIVTPDQEHNKKVIAVSLTLPFNKEYMRNSLSASQFPIIPKEENKLQNDLSQFAGSDTITAIPEVLIKGHVKREFNDEVQEDFQAYFASNIASEDLWSCPNMFFAISKHTAIYDYREEHDFITIISPNSGIAAMTNKFHNLSDSLGKVGSTPTNALFVLDGNVLPLEKGWLMVKHMRPSDLKSLSILKGEDGFFRYGMNAMGGVISITTRKLDDQECNKRYYEWSMRNNHDMKYMHVNIYRYDVEFYNPTKTEISSYPEFQDRPTIYWNPNIYFNGKEPVKIKFPNNYRQGPVLVTINGVSASNLVGSGKFSYRVQSKIKE